MKKIQSNKKSVVISCKKENQITENYISEHEVFIHLMKYACNTKWLGFINCVNVNWPPLRFCQNFVRTQMKLSSGHYTCESKHEFAQRWMHVKEELVLHEKICKLAKMYLVKSAINNSKHKINQLIHVTNNHWKRLRRDLNPSTPSLFYSNPWLETIILVNLRTRHLEALTWDV